MTVRDDDTYIVEVHDDASDRIVLADTRSERAVNHKYTSLGQLQRLRVWAQVW